MKQIKWLELVPVDMRMNSRTFTKLKIPGRIKKQAETVDKKSNSLGLGV